jgi:hypothetical protein
VDFISGIISLGVVGFQEGIPCNGGGFLVAKSLKDKCVNAEGKVMIGNIEIFKKLGAHWMSV